MCIQQLLCCTQHSIYQRQLTTWQIFAKKIATRNQKTQQCQYVFTSNVIKLLLHYIHLTAFFPAQAGKADTRKVNHSGSYRSKRWRHQLDHMEIICTLLQTDNHASTSPLSFYRPDALPAAQTTASKYWRQKQVEVKVIWHKAASLLHMRWFSRIRQVAPMCTSYIERKNGCHGNIP